MAALLEDLLDVARITEGKIELQKQLLDLRDVVAPAVESVQHHLELRGQQVERQLPERPVGVHGNAVRLQQVLSNLLSNASKYSPRGSTIRVRIDVDEHQADLHVIDAGEGIPPDLLQRVFEPFEQLGRRNDRTDGGMGLGLTVAQNLVRMHGGIIEARSDGTGCGSEFHIRLPTVPWEPPVPAVPPEAAVNDRSLTVVIVEDNADARGLLQMLLQQDGYCVSAAGTGDQGLQLIREIRPDVAIVDIGLPGMDGYAVARAVRSQPELQSVLLIALTGYGQASDRLEAIDAGFDTHFTKPVDIKALENKLHQLAIAKATTTA
jgi:CheY-like chemotaxis protein